MSNTPPYGSRTPLSTPVLMARDIILEALMLAVGEVLTEERARERANNAAQGLMPLLEERGRVVSGSIERGANQDYARRTEDFTPPQQCERDVNCYLDNGHAGRCSPYPF